MKQTWSLPARYIIIGIIALAVITIAWWMRVAIEPLAYAAFIAYLVSPLVNFITQRTRLSRTAAVNLVYFTTLALLVAIPATLTPIFSDDINTVTTDVQTQLDNIRVALSQPIHVFNFTLSFQNLADMLVISTKAVAPLPQDALAILKVTSRGALWFVMILIAIYYFLADWPRLRDWFIHLGPESAHSDAYRLYEEIRRVWTSYLLGQLTLMLEVGILFSIVWLALGVPGALLLGALAGFFALVPDIGPSIVAGIATLVALLEGSQWIPLPNTWFAALVLGSYILILNLNNIWARPRILGRSVHIHEGLVFIAIIVAVTVQGVLLAVTIVPLLATVGVLIRYLRARLLGLPAFADEEPASSPDPLPGAPAPAGSKPRKNPRRKTDSSKTGKR